MHHIFYTLIALLLALSFAGCKGKQTQEASNMPNDSTQNADTLQKNTRTEEEKQETETNASSTYHFRPGKVHEGKLVALTFDDGPNSKATLEVLAVLKKYNAVGTFFVLGKNIAGNEEHMRKAVEQGCEICSHTWDHPYLSILTPAEQKQQIQRTSEAIKRAVGYYPNFFRPPYMDADQIVLNNIDLPGVSGVDSDDWMTKHTPRMIVETMLKRTHHNSIYVCHDLAANNRTPVALDSIIPMLQNQGYKFVTVTDIFTSAGVTPHPHALYTSPTSPGAMPASFTYRERMKKKHAKSAKTKDSTKTNAQEPAPAEQ